jgi:hypothetical protein
MEVKFLYELTNRMGCNLYEALREEDFDGIIERETEYYIEQSKVGGERREAFVEWLEGHLSARDWRKIKESVGCDDLSKWLLENPVREREEDLKRSYSESEIEFLTTTLTKTQSGVHLPLLWDHVDPADDADVSLEFGLITYPPVDENGHYIQTGNSRHLPGDVANRIKAVMEEANELAKKTGRGVGSPDPKDDLDRTIDEKIAFLYREASSLSKKTVLSLIRIEGFYCGIHGGTVKYERPIPRSEVLACPSCNHPVCPLCANCYEKDPATIEEAKAYLASCEEVSGMAYCGHCRDWVVEWMLRFLRLKKCPIPPEYENYKPAPRSVRFVATNRVASLPDCSRILESVSRTFAKGISGIIHYPHSTGEIWGIPERHPEGWIVTLCYPEER